MAPSVDPNSGVQALELLGSATNAFVTWLLVVAGWAVIQDQASFQERARANVQRMDELRMLLDDLESFAIGLHIGGFSEIEARKIRRSLKKIATTCKLLAQADALEMQWIRHMVELRQSITLQNFDKSTFQCQSVDSAIVNAIEVARDNFDAYVGSRIVACTSTSRPILQSLKAVAPSIFGKA